MRYVYVLESMRAPPRWYTGSTSDLRRRLAEHNDGKSTNTAPLRPWRLVVAVAFRDADRAVAFERYLKSGSGRSFASRHFR